MAGYNNYFPQSYANNLYGYGNITPTQSMNAPAVSTNQISDINWVQGEAGARSVPLAAGRKALLMDSETNIFYVKSTDSTGMPLPLRAFEYKEINLETDKTTASVQNEYVTHEEFQKAIDELKQSLVPKKEEKVDGFVI